MSIGTVDRVLHNRGEVSAKTREKVLRIIKELEYQPNIIASSLSSKRKFRVGVLCPSPKSIGGYWEGPYAGFIKAANELAQFGVELYYFHYLQNCKISYAKQETKLLSTELEAIIISPIFQAEALSLLSILEEKKIPYLFFDSFQENQKQVSFVGNDNYMSGKVAGRLTHYALQEGDEVCVCHFALDLDNQRHLQRREDGYFSYLDTLNITIVKHQLSFSNDENARSSLQKLLTEQKKVKSIFVSTARTAFVAEVLCEIGREDIMLIGYATTSENLTYLKKGTIDFLISQNPLEQGYLSTITLFNAIVKKQNVATEVNTAIDIITKENYLFIQN